MRYLSIIAILSILISCGGKKNNSNTPQNYSLPQKINIVEGNGKVIPMSGILDLSSEIPGIVKQILVKPSEKVKKGQTLIILDPVKAMLNLSQAKSKLTSQQANIQGIEASIKQEQIELEQFKNDYHTALRLLNKGAETKENVCTLKQKVEIKEQELIKSNSDLKSANSSLNNLKFGVKIAQQNLDNCTITAPSDGQVLDINIERGATVQAYSVLATFAAKEPIIIEAEVDELFANKLKIGQSATIHLIGYSDTLTTAKIYSMMNFLSAKSIFSGASNERQDRQMRKIKLMIDNQGNTPLIGTKVSCKININSSK